MAVKTDEFLHAELQRLDLLIHREILRLRAAYQLSLDEFRGLYVSDEQVDSLLTHLAGDELEPITAQALTVQAEAWLGLNARRAPAHWQRITAEFGLTPVEQDILLLALAPEIDLKYETLYAYLNNDVTRKWATVDLAARVLAASPADRPTVQAALHPQATLRREGLLQLLPQAADRPHALAQGFILAPAAAQVFLGQPPAEPLLDGIVELVAPRDGAWDAVPLAAAQCAQLRQLAGLFSRPSAPLLVFEGRSGSGQDEAVAALFGDLGIPLLRIDLAHARAVEAPLSGLAASLRLQQRLLGAGLLVQRAEALFAAEGHPMPDARLFATGLAGGGQPVVLAFPPNTTWRGLFDGLRSLSVRLDSPDVAQRGRLWRMALAETGANLNADAIDFLAGRFILTPGQIRAAAIMASDQACLDASTVQLPHLVEAARAQSGHELARLATKVPCVHTWDDLVLPPATLQRVKEIAGAVRHQHVVYSHWGFDRRIAAGRGVKILFAGASGTGKTMTAGVIARDADLHLYRIDLSSVVSKYIGETEKNLEAIFRAAYGSNAILFFDEADALFGKRSEVKDAHDRYANIEVSYLLQRMEQHEGTVILASNLGKNIDEAFSRRLHAVIEFPLPDETHREKLWRGMFPSQAPLGEDVDLPFLARHFSLAGGDIQNVALDAAFLAAQDGRVITMKHMAQAMARQMLKQGRVPSVADFRQHYALLAPE